MSKILSRLLNLLLLTSITLFVSCSKDLDPIESESITSNVFSIEEILNNTTKLQLGAGTKSIKSKVAKVYAINSKEKKLVSNIETPEKFKPLFKDLELLLPENKKQIIVRFKLTENFLVAYKEDSLSLNNDKYLFQFKIENYGIKRKRKDEKNNETKNIEFHATSKSQATHIKINALSSARIMGGLENLNEKEKREIILKSEINNKLFTKSDLKTLLNDRTLLKESRITQTKFNDNEKFFLKVYKDETYIYSIKKAIDLEKKEKEALKNTLSIKSILPCSAELKQTQDKDCYLRSEYKFTSKRIRQENLTDSDGKILSTIKFTEVNKETEILKININSITDTKSELLDAFADISKLIIIDKKNIDLDGEYLFLPSTHGAPRDIADASSFFQGDEKIVNLKMTRDGIEVFEKDKDPRFKDNELNNSPVLKISGDHIDFDCLEKENGSCVDQLRWVTSSVWEKRRFFFPKLDSIKTYQLNTLDLFNLGSQCFREVDSRMSHYEFTEGVINVEQEKTFVVNQSFQCIAKLYFQDNLKASSFKMKFFYSLVKLDKLVSKDYTPVDYPTHDHRLFGFFKNKIKKIDQDFTSSRTRDSYLLNRFNPKKKTITYELSEEFGHKENKYILDATKDVIDSINQSLKKAEAGINLKLNAPKKVYPGDLRNNSIVLITEPLANGLLGYGPSVTNPKTGEIVQAHTNMYLGVLRTTARRVYKYMENMTKESPIKFESENVIGNTSDLQSENRVLGKSIKLHFPSANTEESNPVTNIKTSLSSEAIEKLDSPL